MSFRTSLVLAVAVVLLLLSNVMPAKADVPDGSAYLDGGASDAAVILCHGHGQGPTWKVVDPLRKAIHKELGMHTLSLQLPNDKKKKWDKYGEDFPEAYRTISDGLRFLREEKGVKTIYIMGHSMGSRMATAYLAEYPDSGIAGMIGVGMRGKGNRSDVLDSLTNLQRAPELPIFDVWGTGGDGDDEKHGEERRATLEARGNYTPHIIGGANHTFDGNEKEMTDAVVIWLRGR